jgi:cell surface protein SprA
MLGTLLPLPGKQSDLFPESELNNDLAYGYNRAKLAWYIIDPSFYTRADQAFPTIFATTQRLPPTNACERFW